MAITFCDLCDESIPLADLENGLAVRRGERAICARCELAMASDEPAGADPLEEHPGHARHARSAPAVQASAPAAGHGGGPALLISVLSLGFALAASLYLLRRIDRGGRDLASLRAGQEAELARHGQELGQRMEARAAESAEEARSALEEARALALRLEDGEAASDRDLADLREELARLAERAEAAPATAAGEPQVSAQDFARLEREVADLRRELGRLGEALERDASAAEGQAPSSAAAPERPAWWPLLTGLQSRSASERWTAVQALGQAGDPASVEHVVPLLKDPDIFVRIATCRVLADLRAVRAIPALIDALEDAEPSVREGALSALRTISGQDLRFDPNASASERAKRVEAWRDWWNGAKDELLSG
jgi:HEAT repeat protein